MRNGDLNLFFCATCSIDFNLLESAYSTPRVNCTAHAYACKLTGTLDNSKFALDAAVLLKDIINVLALTSDGIWPWLSWHDTYASWHQVAELSTRRQCTATTCLLSMSCDLAYSTERKLTVIAGARLHSVGMHVA